MEGDCNCEICGLNKSKYSCPKCHISYCSVSCYQSEDHLQCSELFYKELVQEELKNCQSNPEARKKMLEILRQNQETSSDECLDSDDEELVPDLASRMMNVNLNDEDAVWEKLTKEERQEFRKLVSSGNIMKVLPEWEPWWKTKKRKELIQDLDDDLDWKSKLPAVPSEIPQLLTLTKVSPSPYVPFMLLNVLMSYVYTVQWFKGAHELLPVEGISTCVALSAALRTGTVFKCLLEAFVAFENDLSQCKWVKNEVYNREKMQEDLEDIVKGSDGNDLFFSLKTAICDINCICLQALDILKEDKTNHLKRICPKGSTAISYTDDLELLASGQEDGSILLFGKEGEPRMLFDYEMRLQKEPCTDLKIKSSPKGGYNKTLLAGYLSGHIKLWDTTIGKVLYTLKENRHLYGLQYHPRSHMFVSVGNDFKVNVYDEETRVTERVLSSSGIIGCKNGHTNSVCSAAFHPYNDFELISGGVDNTIQFWDMRVPFAVRNIEGITMYGDALDVSEDGKVILCGLSSSWEAPVQVFDYATGRLLKVHTKPGCFVYCCKFLTPAFVGVGGFYQHTFRIVNMKMSQVYGYVSGLPGCVMNFAICRKVPRFRTYPDELPTLAFSSGDKVFEIEMVYPEENYEPTDFYYYENSE